MNFTAVENAFADALDSAVFPGAVLVVGNAGQVVYESAFGCRSLVPEKSPLSAGMVFDVASLTKPLATSMAVMRLVQDKQIRLEDPVTRFVPAYGVPGGHGTVIRHLLNHSSGLPAWRPFYKRIFDLESATRLIGRGAVKKFVFEQIHAEMPLHAPGSRCLYSDLGFMLLGEIIEAASGTSLDRFCDEQIFAPLGLRSTAFLSLDSTEAASSRTPGANMVPTENCPWRKKILCGEVHDDNAYAMGGVAGHAGLFASASDIHRLLVTLRHCLRGESDFVHDRWVARFLARDESVPNSTYALGWDTPSPGHSASGSYFSSRSVGHLGYTGTSFWWDLEKDCHIILLTNRVHPARDNEKIKEFRPYIHDLIFKVLFS